MFWVISVYFNIRNTLPKSGTFLLGQPVYVTAFWVKPQCVLLAVNNIVTMNSLTMLGSQIFKQLNAAPILNEEWQACPQFGFDSFYHIFRRKVAELCAIRWTAPMVFVISFNTLRTGLLNCLNARSRGLTFRHRASCTKGQAFHYFPENAFYIFNQQIYFII